MCFIGGNQIAFVIWERQTGHGRILDYNLPPDFVSKQNKILKGMTVAQMKANAARFLKPEQINILLVGDKAKILDSVKKLGYEVVELDTDGNKVDVKKAF